VGLGSGKGKRESQREVVQKEERNYPALGGAVHQLWEKLKRAMPEKKWRRHREGKKIAASGRHPLVRPTEQILAGMRECVHSVGQKKRGDGSLKIRGGGGGQGLALSRKRKKKPKEVISRVEQDGASRFNLRNSGKGKGRGAQQKL